MSTEKTGRAGFRLSFIPLVEFTTRGIRSVGYIQWSSSVLKPHRLSDASYLRERKREMVGGAGLLDVCDRHGSCCARDTDMNQEKTDFVRQLHDTSQHSAADADSSCNLSTDSSTSSFQSDCVSEEAREAFLHAEGFVLRQAASPWQDKLIA